MDFLFPRRCPFCDKVVRYGEMVCRVCSRNIPYIGEDHCLKCGKPLLKKDEEYCRDCVRTKHLFTKGRSLYVYGGEVRESIGRFKFHGRREYADFYGRDIVRHLGSFINRCGADIIIPVPISKEKMERRGYNQAGLLADRISSFSGIPVESSLVTRIRNTPPMKELTRTERMKNLKGAFKIGAIDVKCRNVLIVDDIYTTGSTLDAIAGELKKAGADNIYFVTLAAGSPV